MFNRKSPAIKLLFSFCKIAGLFAVSFLLAGLFVVSSLIRLGLALPAALMLSAGLKKLSSNRLQSNRREQYKALLSYLLAQASIGRSLEQSIASAHQALAIDYPVFHPFSLMLQQAEHQILGNQPVAAVIDDLVQQLYCPEASIGLGILRRIPLSGSTLVTYLRRADQSLADLVEIKRDIAAQHARTASEAVILAVMPFILAFLLNRSGGYFEPASQHPGGTIVLGCSFLVAILALAIIPGTVTPQTSKPLKTAKQRQSKIPSRSGQQKGATRLRKLLTRILGESWNRRLSEALLRVYGEKETSRSEYDLQKLNYLIAGLFTGLLLAFACRQPLFAPVPAVALIFLQDQQLFRRAKQEELVLLASFPYFLQVNVSLLETGLTTHHVLDLTTTAFAEVEAKTSDQQVAAGTAGSIPVAAGTPMGRDALQIKKGLLAGWPVERVLAQVAQYSTTSELRAAYQMLLRYSQLGGVELLQQLLQQAQACWTVYRSTSRSSMDEQSIRMFLPMMLDLSVILTVSLTPALIMLATSS